MQSEFIESKKEADNIVSFFFSKPGAFAFDAGDFTELAIDYPSGGGRRWFTIASAPEEKDIQITMKFPPEPSEFKKQLYRLKPKTKVALSPALGKFNLPRDKAESLLFVAGGIGVTPYRSMLKHIVLNNEQRDIELVYIAKDGEHVFKDLLADSCAKVRYETHDFDLQTLDTENRTIFISGPEPMMKNYFEALLGAGIHRSQIKLDYFPGYTEL